MRALTLVLVAVLLVGAACGDDDQRDATVTGVVTAVDGDLSGVESFTIATETGEVLTFEPDEGLLFDGGPLSHLDSHRLSGVPVAVVYEDRDGILVAIEITDAR